MLATLKAKKQIRTIESRERSMFQQRVRTVSHRTFLYVAILTFYCFFCSSKILTMLDQTVFGACAASTPDQICDGKAIQIRN